MTPVRRRRLERMLWLTLGHWYAFYLAVGYECLQQSGTAWLAALPWASYGTEVVVALAGDPLAPGAVLLAYFTVLVSATLLMLVAALRAVIAEEAGEPSQPSPRKATQPAKVLEQVARSAPDDQPESMQMLVERFRERVARL